jgi:hypothetical protein
MEKEITRKQHRDLMFQLFLWRYSQIESVLFTPISVYCMLSCETCMCTVYACEGSEENVWT